MNSARRAECLPAESEKENSSFYAVAVDSFDSPASSDALNSLASSQLPPRCPSFVVGESAESPASAVADPFSELSVAVELSCALTSVADAVTSNTNATSTIVFLLSDAID